MRNFKKTMSVLLATIMAFSAFSALTFTASAAEVDSSNSVSAEFGDYEYQVLDDGTAEITGYIGNDTELIIPSEINGYKVTSIGYSAFSIDLWITAVTIPNSVTDIGDSAFYGCENLKNIIIPKSVTSIGGHAFLGTAWLNNQPDGVIYINDIAYTYKGEMPKNTSITLLPGTKAISSNAFSHQAGLISIDIPDSVNNIGTSAFSFCMSLTSVTIPDSVTSIDLGTFMHCLGLTSVIISKNVSYISGNAFQGCNYLTIYGYKGTAAEKYANKNEITFVALDDSIGDVNGDGALSVADATIIQKCIASITELTPEQLVLADFNGDGAVNVNDATAIQRALVK